MLMKLTPDVVTSSKVFFSTSSTNCVEHLGKANKEQNHLNSSCHRFDKSGANPIKRNMS